MRIYNSPAELLTDAGKEIGVSKWRVITQDMVTAFADATHDHQWIHVDTERALRELPDGKTIAHGYLLLSLGPALMDEVCEVRNISKGLNYGSDKIRFVSPVQTGSQVRLRVAFADAEEREAGQYRIKILLTMEIEGVEKPAFVQEVLALYFD